MTPRVLVVSPVCPVPATAGAAIRIRDWLQAAAPAAELAVATLVRTAEEADGLAELEELAANVTAVRAPRTALARLGDHARAAITRRPVPVAAGSSRRLAEAIRSLIRAWRPEIVQLEQLSSSSYLRLTHPGRHRTVYSAHNVESELFTSRKGPTARLETSVACSVDRVVAVTSRESAWFERRGATAVHIPNALWLDRYPPRRVVATGVAPELLFVGHLGYPPNSEAAVRLVRDILPRVRAELPDVRCVVAGRRPGRAVRRLARLGAEVLPDRPDLESVWERATLFVCPLRRGAGSRLKLIEAAARGVPIVSTGIGAEGLALDSPRDLVIAESDGDLAAAVVQTIRDPLAAARRTAEARCTVEEHHDWRRLAPRVHELYAGLTHHHRP